MWSTSTTIALAATIASVSALNTGFALESTLSTGDCRSQADWEAAFAKIASFPGAFKSARLFASAECDTLKNAVPAAIKTGTSLLAGIALDDAATFDSEKTALLNAIQTNGNDWLAGVVVGQYSLLTNETTAQDLATKVFDVRGMINSVGATKPVGHADDFATWIDPANADVIKAVDFLGVNNYPCSKGIGVDNGLANDDYWQTTDKVRAVAQGKEVWTTETGQPGAGDTNGENVASQNALQIYWWQVSCTAKKEMNYYFYDLDDFDLNPTFAVVDTNGNPIIDMTCTN